MSHRNPATRAALVAAISAAALVTALPAPGPAPASAPVPAPFTEIATIAGIADVGAAVALDEQLAAHQARIATRATAVQQAMSKIGRPYRYGATGPNAFDCSGLVVWSFKQAGVSLPRTSRAQSQVGTPVSRADLQPGDLVFFYKPVSHVAIYIGNGKIVHASTSGSPVKVSTLVGKTYHSARRV